MYRNHFLFNFRFAISVLIFTLVVGMMMNMEMPPLRSFGYPIIVCIVLSGAYVIYTRWRPNEVVASTCLGLISVVLFLKPALFFSYITTRLDGPNADAAFTRFDQLLGFDWIVLTDFAAQYPLLMEFASKIYSSSMTLTLISLFMVGMFLEKPERLHQFATQFMVAIVLCSVIGGLLPVEGFYVYHDVSADVMAAIKPVVGPVNMALIDDLRTGDLNSLYIEGGLGVISFPSFHTILSLMLIWLARGTGWFFVISLVWNGAIILCTPIMGNHYVADVLGGAVVTVVTIIVCNRVYSMLDARKNQPHINLSPQET